MLGLDPASLGVMVYADLAGQVDPGHKKVPKIYHAAVHPTRCGCRPAWVAPAWCAGSGSCCGAVAAGC